MKLLADLHHQCLFESHQLTFGDRFAMDVFAPYGMEWFDNWTWSFEREHHGDAVARQYLLGVWAGGVEVDGIMTVDDAKHPGRKMRGMTYDRAMSEDWDLVISSVPSNAPGFEKFARENGARWGIHVGNQWGDEAWSRSPSFAVLTTTSPVPGGIPYVTVRQEFSLADFHADTPVDFGPIRSFVNCFPENNQACSHGTVSSPAGEYGYFTDIARSAPDLEWGVYGAYGTAPSDEFAAGNIPTDPLEGTLMRGAGVIWHAKHWSDGYGHVIHRAFASGRPVFGYEEYYADKLAGPLWVDGVTSIDIGRRTRDEVVTELRRLRDDPDHYLRMCENSAARFREVVDFSADADALADLLGLRVAA